MSEATAGSGASSGSSPNVFSPRTAIALVLVGVFAFAGFVTLLAYTPDLIHDPFCRANAVSKCAIGYAGLESAVKADGAPVLESRTELPKGHTEGLLIATPEPEKAADVTGLGFGGPVLVVMPKWDVQPDPSRLSWGQKVGLLAPDDMPHSPTFSGVTYARRSGISRPQLTGAPATPFAGLVLTPGPIDSEQTLSAKGWIPVLTDETGQAVLAQVPSTNIYVLADPDLVNTQGLANLDTFGAATTLVRTLRAGDGPVIFDLTLNGYKRDRSSLKLMFDPPFLAVTVCVFAALLLAGWQAMFRFGPLRRTGRAYALGKEGLADNSAQLIRLARREAKMAPRYAALTRTAAAKAVGAPRELAGEALTGFLDRIRRRNSQDGDTLAGLAAEAEQVRDRAGLTVVAKKLYQWRLEMTRERQ